MASNHKRRNNGHASRATGIETHVPAWVWLFTGAVLGAFVMFLVRLSETDTNRSSPAVAPRQVSEQTGKQHPQFDFYDLLKETKVEIPDSPGQNPETAQQEEAPDIEYILQVASFKQEKEAEQLRAELILLNMDAQVEKANVRNGETWHRVLVGPFESRSRLAKARSTLVSHNHEALVLKRAKKG